MSNGICFQFEIVLKRIADVHGTKLENQPLKIKFIDVRDFAMQRGRKLRPRGDDDVAMFHSRREFQLRRIYS